MTIQRSDLMIGREVTGPTAIGTDRHRFWNLTWTLAITEFKLRFFGSVLGYFWQLMRPLLLFAILYAVFVGILKSGGGEPMFGVALLLGIVVFQFFTDATSLAVKSLVANEGLIRKVDFPRAVIPTSCALQALFNFLLNLVPVAIFLFAAGGRISWGWLAIPPIIAMLLLFVTGLSLFLSALYVSFRDVDPIWAVVSQALFYGTPILYSLSVVSDKIGTRAAGLMLLNPLATAIQSLRHFVVSPEYESPSDVFGSWAGVLAPCLIASICFALGVWYFGRSASRIAEKL